MKFDLNKYKGKFVMHCNTKEDAENFCEYLQKTENIKVNLGFHYMTGDNVYYFNEGVWSERLYAVHTGYTILEWEDFMKKTFTKADLKTGDIIKQRNGEIGVINRHLEMITCKNGGWIDLDRFRDDLTHEWSKEFDIVLVRRPKAKADCNFDAIRREWGDLVYDRERDEVEEMTLEQVCKLLGKNIKIIK